MLLLLIANEELIKSQLPQPINCDHNSARAERAKRACRGRPAKRQNLTAANKGKLVLKKWTQIRDSCCKYIRKRKNKRHFSPKPYKYFQELAFLQKVAYIPYSRINEENDEGDEESESEGKVSDVEQETDTSNCAEVLIYSGDEIPNEESSGIAVKEENKIDFSAFQRNPYEVDDTMTKYLNSSNAPKQKEDDPNLHFFKGILPAVSTLNEDETLQFQSGVLTLLQTIKKQRQIQKQSPVEVNPMEMVGANEGSAVHRRYVLVVLQLQRYAAAGVVQGGGTAIVPMVTTRQWREVVPKRNVLHSGYRHS
ncbi:hypothetical protein MSG28_010278 [Choristoneura fumiferana]|uniref:Uncharacterized protein n=1 Tax=Choristoneura fumiferana TaxID=7141 RepID=A0ACC0KKK1_CHOFU|nr:hypothetical protein MSG28_010278 [Choristoneura fumiferana]